MHKRINEVQSYLMGDIGEVNPDDILREIKKELKKKGSQQGRDYLVEIFFKYNNLKIQFEKPSFIFDKPKMHYLSMRWQHSIVSEKDYLRNRENALTPHPPQVDSNSYVLTDRKYSNKPIPSDTRLAKVNLRLQQFKPNETDKLVTGEDIKMYKKFTSLSEKERNHKLLVLDSIINRILVIVNENKLIPKYRGIVLKHIRINESWNKNKLGL